MRLLVYGFKPYGGYQENISELLLARLPVYDGMVKKVFDVKFDAAMFNRTLARIKPDCVLGLGQHPRARKLRIERKAMNLSIEPDRSLVPISSTGPQSIYATLPLPETAQTTVTYNAGTYVCNYSMYLIGQYCGQHHKKFGFIHIPKDHDMKMLSAYMQTAIRRILRGHD